MTEEKKFIITEEEMRGVVNFLKNSNLHVQAMPINMMFDKVRTHSLAEELVREKRRIYDLIDSDENNIRKKERESVLNKLSDVMFCDQSMRFLNDTYRMHKDWYGAIQKLRNDP